MNNGDFISEGKKWFTWEGAWNSFRVVTKCLDNMIGVVERYRNFVFIAVFTIVKARPL